MEPGKRSQKRHAGTANEHCCQPKEPKTSQNVSFQRDRFGVSEKVMAKWTSFMNAWFPHLLTCIYFVPPLQMNSVHETSEYVAGVEVRIPQPPVDVLLKATKTAKKTKSCIVQVSKVREEQTQHRILSCLSKLRVLRQDAMVVITGLEFTGYLANASNTKLHKKLRDDPRGDFDILIIHRRLGLFLAEIKTVGDILDTKKTSEEEKEDIVRERIKKAGEQLQKGENMLRHFLSDIHKTPRISCLLMLPNMDRKKLRTIINNCSDVCNNLRIRLGIKGRCDPADFCLCADDLSDVSTPYDITEDSQAKMCRWWERVAGCGEDPNMTDDIYEELVLRFAGPPTINNKCNFRAIDEALSVTGDKFSCDRLTSEQRQVVECQDPLVHVNGPPGTGKTLGLTLKGMEWCSRGKEVHLLCTWASGLAAALYIKHMIETRTPKEARGLLKIHIHRFYLREEGQLEEAVECLSNAAVPNAEGTDRELYVIADEAYAGSEFEALCDQLRATIPRVHIWAACVYHGHRPRCMREIAFTQPLRTPPVVTEEVKKSEYIGDGFVHNYSPQSAHSPQPPTNGKSLEYLSHRGPEHSTGRGPADCEKCGRKVAKKRKELKVGGTLLKYSDVFLLWVETSFDGLVEEKRDSEGNVEQPASGMIRALRDAGVPVRIVEPDDVAAIEDVAKMAGPDAVIAANAETIRGLERKIVVWLQADKEDDDSDEMSFGRLDAMSRATAHVIVVS